MKLQHAEDQKTQRSSSESFSGTAWQQTLAVGEAPNPLHVARVTFEPGARTVWHAHPHGQVLIATAGVGRFQSAGGPVLSLLPGDSVTIAPGEKHWHGAAPPLAMPCSTRPADGCAVCRSHPTASWRRCDEPFPLSTCE